jgi:uncharacterized protein (TIGR02001 family)
MRFSTISLAALALAVAATPAMAQDVGEPVDAEKGATESSPPLTVSGNVTGTTDYRFRGLSQSNDGPAGQITLNVNHESGLYVGTFVSSIDDEVSLPGYGEMEIDLYGGYSKTLDSGLGFDVGLLYYLYADAPQRIDGEKNKTDFFEPYASVNYSIGPANLKVGGNYAWSQGGLGDEDSLYLYSNLSIAVPSTPVKFLGHIGRSDGALGAFNLDEDDDTYLDWSLGLEASYSHFTLGVQYVDTDITSQRIPGFGKFDDVTNADGTVLAYITASF